MLPTPGERIYRKNEICSKPVMTYQASEIQSVNTSAFYGTYVSSIRSGSIGVEKSLELYKRTES